MTLRAALLAASSLLLAACSGPLRVEPLSRNATPLVVDAHLELARAYAPWLLLGVHPELGRHDLPTRVDFDGNLRGDDAWESLPRWALPPVVYYAVLETATHWFIAYHVFHPRDESCVRLGLHEAHENDGENLQVVVDKASGRVALLFTQAHYFGRVHAAPGRGATSRAEPLAGEALLFDDAGRPSATGKHPVVYVQPWGHGIYAARDAADAVTVDADGRVTFADHGLVLRPAPVGVAVPEEPAIDAGEASYALASTTAALWPGLRDGSLVGEGGLFDGCLPFAGPRGEVQVPRYYEADRFSGPFGPDRGISPFALDTSFWTGTLGALFFDPARRWRELVTLPGPWSMEYVDYPFTPSPAR